MPAPYRPLCDLPNVAGFAFVGLRRDGSETRCAVYRDAHGLHRVPGFADLVGWLPLPREPK